MVSSLCLFYSFLFSSFRVVMLLQMAGVKYSMLKSLSNTISLSLSAPTIHCYGSIRNCTTVDRISHVRPLASWMNRSNYSATSIKLYQLGRQAHIHGQTSINYSGISQVLLNSHVRCSLPLLKQSPVLSCRNFSSNSSNPVDNSKGLKVSEASGTNGGDANVSDGIMGSEWIDKLKDVSQSAMDTLVNTGQNAKESSDKLSSYAQEFLDSYPYLKDVIVPVGGTLTATLMAWLIMPRILRRFHKYSQQGSAALLPGSIMSVEVPYEKSFWGALEDPVRYLVTFIAFSQIAMMVAPNAIGPQYVLQAWSGASVMSLVWIIHRWKTNVLSRALAAQGMHKVDREKLLTVDRISSVGLFIIGLMALAEACGVAVQSILTVGGVGGVATAFAARDVLGNVLSGLSVQFSKPFSLGDTIKAGSVEGQVVEIGLTTTSLLNAEKFPVIVPNSLFASQVIINKSRAQWRAFVTKIPISIDNLETVPCISEDIKSMLKSNPKVFLGKETPYCFLSQIGSPFAELTLGCNLKHMSKDDLYSAGQDILIQSTKIIKQHGATIGSIWQNVPS